MFSLRHLVRHVPSNSILSYNSSVLNRDGMLRCLSTGPFGPSGNTYPFFDERDVVEQYVSGGGPGGMNVNKSQNCCVLTHTPTGMCHSEFTC
jgi:hypothetical protein